MREKKIVCQNKMNDFACGKKWQILPTNSWNSTGLFIGYRYRDLIVSINPFLMHVFYFIFLSFVGFGILKALKARTSFEPRNIDLFFTSVSASTVSSMSTVEMEVFSNEQLIVMTILMFVGGEIFTSMVGLHIKRSNISKITWKSTTPTKNDSVASVISNSYSPRPPSYFDHIVTVPDLGNAQFESKYGQQSSCNISSIDDLKYDSIKLLSFVVLGYLLAIQILGVASVLIYLTFVSSAENVLRNKGIKTFTFAVFTIVSTFASCGFVPTNENMMVFSKNSGLLLILIAQVLFGNTLFPSCLRFLIWVLGKRFRKLESKYILENTAEVEYLHLLPRLHSKYLVATVFGLILIGFILFSALEWNSAAIIGLNTYQKLVGVVFQSVNARHTGETIVDLSTIAPSILVFFIFMMYLPPYTSFLPIKSDEEQSPLKSEGGNKKRRRLWALHNLIFSQLSYLVIFIILICITERQKVKEDPINFSVLNITVEVISAYGNVSFTTGYSCERQIWRDPNCVNKWYGFSGKWSDEGKVILIIVMFFGRLKQFNMGGGRACKLL